MNIFCSIFFFFYCVFGLCLTTCYGLHVCAFPKCVYSIFKFGVIVFWTDLWGNQLDEFLTVGLSLWNQYPYKWQGESSLSLQVQAPRKGHKSTQKKWPSQKENTHQKLNLMDLVWDILAFTWNKGIISVKSLGSGYFCYGN